MNETQEKFHSLKKEILLLEGLKDSLQTEEASLGRMNEAFPNRVFPFSALHEFFCFSPEEAASSSAFITGLLSSRLSKGGTIAWIGSSLKLFPPALKWFGIQPHQVMFLRVKKESEAPWAIHEALKCSSLSAVVGELPEMDLTASRRFQLAIESAGVGCFILRRNPKNLLTAAVSRWHIRPLHTQVEDVFPGLGHPRWQVNLLKVRNGKAGTWDVEWVNGGFRHASRLAVLPKAVQKQTG